MARKGAAPKREEERVACTHRLTKKLKRRLDALAQLRDMNNYEVLEEAFWVFWNDLPEAERGAAEKTAQIKEDYLSRKA